MSEQIMAPARRLQRIGGGPSIALDGPIERRALLEDLGIEIELDAREDASRSRRIEQSPLARLDAMTELLPVSWTPR